MNADSGNGRTSIFPTLNCKKMQRFCSLDFFSCLLWVLTIAFSVQGLNPFLFLFLLHMLILQKCFIFTCSALLIPGCPPLFIACAPWTTLCAVPARSHFSVSTFLRAGEGCLSQAVDVAACVVGDKRFQKFQLPFVP